MTWVILGTAITSLALSFAWWCKVRVVDLRQDLFDIRDEMWDRAHEIGALDDTAYRAAREHLNSLARHAHEFNIPVLAYLLASEPDGGYPKYPKSDRQDVQEIVDSAIDASSTTLVHYLLRKTLAGRIGGLFFGISRVGKSASQMLDEFASVWVRSNLERPAYVAHRPPEPPPGAMARYFPTVSRIIHGF